jgi:flavin reductase (DIM6/NTAB) family NADH-FMN oxidoreductase RutF
MSQQGMQEQIVLEPTNKQWFRQVLGQYPTGVCVVTALPPDGRPAGMAIGSFTSVSLNPPLVAFFPEKGSTSWRRIKSAGRFCVNILGADQEATCRRFASKLPDKFEGIEYRPSTAGCPIIAGAVAWIDCELNSVYEAGDHDIVVGLVRELKIESTRLPLLFFQGRYGRPGSLAAPDTLDAITEQFRNIEMARAEMNMLAENLSARCIATARVDDELVVVASAGSSNGSSLASLVGQRLPFMPPTGSVFAAWNGDAEIEDWLRTTVSLDLRNQFRSSLAIVRDRGYAIGVVDEARRVFAATLNRLAADRGAAPAVDLRELIQNLSYDVPNLSPSVWTKVRLISAPVFGPKGTVALVLTVYEFPKPPADAGVRFYVDHVIEASKRVTQILGGSAPAQ